MTLDTNNSMESVDSTTWSNLSPGQNINIGDTDQVVVPFWNWSSISIETNENYDYPAVNLEEKFLKNKTSNDCFRLKTIP